MHRLLANIHQVVFFGKVPESNHLLTVSEDKNVQMWYFSVASQGSIIPMLSFRCLFTPICASVIPHRVCIVGEDTKSSTYPVNMYDITNNLSLAHPPEFEHTSLVVAISSSVKFRIFATASNDGILKIWDDQNILVSLPFII